MVVCGVQCIEKIVNFLEIKCGTLFTNESGKIPIVTVLDGNRETISGFGTIVISLAKQCKKSQFGKMQEDEALVRQWVEYAVCYGNYVDLAQTARQVLKELNAVLATRSYFVGNSQTLADIVLYYILHGVMVDLTYQEKEQYLHLSRWFNNIQQDPNLRQKNKLVHFSRTPLYS